VQNWNAHGSADSPVSDLSGRLAVELVADDRGVAVKLAGELDLETAPELDRRLAGIDLDGVACLLIDLRDVTFMDSTGLGSIVAAHRLAEGNGHKLVLRRGSRQVRRLFELTGLNDRMSFVDD
jgi:anti-sigma B factor antagonist